MTEETIRLVRAINCLPEKRPGLKSAVVAWLANTPAPDFEVTCGRNKIPIGPNYRMHLEALGVLIVTRRKCRHGGSDWSTYRLDLERLLSFADKEQEHVYD